jgi:hypothetical protein
LASLNDEIIVWNLAFTQLLCYISYFTPINIENKELEPVKLFKYLGSIVNTDNKMEEEIIERIAIGNKVYIANKKDVSKQAHIK